MLPVAIVIFLKDIEDSSLKLWVQVRSERGPLDGLLEFPGGKIENGESAQLAAQREVFEEVGVSVDLSKLKLLKLHRHSYEDREVLLHVYFSNYFDLPTDKGHWIEIGRNDVSSPFQGKIPEVNHVLIDELVGYIYKQKDKGFLELVWQK